MADVGSPGRHSDGDVFAHSEMGQRFISQNMFLPPPEKLTENGPELPHVLVGDEAFALSNFLMKPYAINLALKESVFNYRLSRARRVVECTFGIMSAVWRIFKSPPRTKLPTSLKIIKAIICLHNFILRVDPQRQKIINLSNTQEAYENCFEDIPSSMEMQNVSGANLDRENFARYFLTSGAVGFQWDKAFNADF